MNESHLPFLALEQELWGGYERPSFRRDRQVRFEPERSAEQLLAAWDGRRWAEFMTIASARLRAGRLGRKDALRLASIYVQTRRLAEAVELFETYDWKREKDAAYWRGYAQALAGVGRLRDAKIAAGRCLRSLAGDKVASELIEVINRTELLQRRRPSMLSWHEFSPLIKALFHFSWLPGARQAVRAYLGQCDPPAKGELEEISKAVQAAIATMPQEEVFAFAALFKRVFSKPRDQELIKDVLEVMADGAKHTFKVRDDGCSKVLRLWLALACAQGGRRKQAIELLGRLTAEYEKDWTLRLPLARFAGQDVLADNPPAFTTRRERRIFDLVIFNNEKELLKLKLAEEAPWVDHFVIVEASQTFSGLPKELYFEQWKEEFAEYADKIIHVKVKKFPLWATSAWAREFYQKDMAVTGAAGLWTVDDLVMLTDVDEIVDRRAVEHFDGEFAAMKMHTYRYFLNYRTHKETQWTGVILRAKYLQKLGFSYARNLLRSYELVPVMDDCGWHFSSIADEAGVAEKMRSYSHQEYAHKDEAYYERVFGKLREGRNTEDWQRQPIDDSFPAYIREHSETLSRFILPPLEEGEPPAAEPAAAEPVPMEPVAAETAATEAEVS